MPGDLVKYVGGTFSKDLHSKTGIVVAHIEGEPNGIIVEFGDNTYVLNVSSLYSTHRSPSKTSVKSIIQSDLDQKLDIQQDI
jgi:hypothetical protein